MHIRMLHWYNCACWYVGIFVFLFSPIKWANYLPNMHDIVGLSYFGSGV